MALDSLIDTALKGLKRSQELRKERQFQYGQWIDELNNELEIFIQRTKRLDLAEAENRDTLYNKIEELEERLQDLRNRRIVTEAPPNVIIELEDLIGVLDDCNNGGFFFTSFPPSEEEIERSEKRRKEWAEEDMEAVLKQIERFSDVFQSEIEDNNT